MPIHPLDMKQVPPSPRWPTAPTFAISRYAHKPGIIAKDGRLYHFYCAVAPSPSKPVGQIEYNELRGISVATSS